MKIKTKDLTGAALDWAVGFARCLEANGGRIVQARDLMGAAMRNGMASPSTDWVQGGPIIEREQISVDFDADPECGGPCAASTRDSHCYWVGPTPLIAALRCYVASKLGNEVDVPKELM